MRTGPTGIKVTCETGDAVTAKVPSALGVNPGTGREDTPTTKPCSGTSSPTRTGDAPSHVAEEFPGG